MEDCGVDLSNKGEARELLSLLLLKEISQVGLAQAAAARVAPSTGATGASLKIVARPVQGDNVAGAASSPSTRCPARTRRVAKAFTARGIRLRNRII